MILYVHGNAPGSLLKLRRSAVGTSFSPVTEEVYPVGENPDGLRGMCGHSSWAVVVCVCVCV